MQRVRIIGCAADGVFREVRVLQRFRLAAEWKCEINAVPGGSGRLVQLPVSRNNLSSNQ
jgi:hypothetical protein